MIRVQFQPPATEAWKKWLTDTEKATKKLMATATKGKVKFNDALYKRQRQELFDAFHGKCAYCEVRFILNSTGDVEHFRPKAGVVDEDGRPVFIKRRKKHPGYFWLAYDWHNLLPSCEKCNRLSKTREGKVIGKGNRFPLLLGKHALCSEELNQEVPKFLHPSFDDPEQHLELDPRTGIIGGTTERGRACVDLLGLNREGLPEARKAAHVTVCAVLADAGHAHSFEALTERLALLDRYKKGIEPFSLAGSLALKERRTMLKPLYDLLFG